MHTNGNGTRDTVRVTCHAQHPDPKRAAGELCGSELGDLPGPARFVGVAARRPLDPDGRIRLQCRRRDCRTWNIFEPDGR